MTFDEELALWACDHSARDAAIDLDATTVVERYRRAIVAVLLGCEIDDADEQLARDVDLGALVGLLAEPLRRMASRCADLAREVNDLRHQLARAHTLGHAARDRMAAQHRAHEVAVASERAKVEEAIASERAKVAAACARYKARADEGEAEIGRYRAQRDTALRFAVQFRAALAAKESGRE